MKYILSVLFLLHFSIQGYSQVVTSSSCEAPDSIRALYERDAAHLTWKYIYDLELKDTSNVFLPDAFLDTFMNALLAVYNAPLPQADTVAHIFDIHHYPLFSLESLVVSADSTEMWMKQLRQGNIPTGYDNLDSLMSLYHLHVQHYYAWPPSFGYHSVALQSEQYLNMKPLAEKLKLLSGIHYVDLGGFIGDGPKIFASIHSDYILINYLNAWGDCPAGCLYHYGWQFKVNWDCQVEFIKNIFTKVDDLELAPKVMLSPNPFHEEINIIAPRLAPNFDYELYDLVGQLASKGQADGYRISGLGDLTSGVYWLRIPNIKTLKVVKF
ncbi:MAG TPA: T9SS type A sorting domain-containing protein [Saprospiraceae bacterium]|nr:T9SS type A sorting domain-containing protein [Saprospiraceae bacterium]